MIVNGLPMLNPSPRRISFVQASSLLVAQALTDANERLSHHFPALSSATWGDVLRQLQPDLLVDGRTITFDWPSLARRVQGLAAFPNLPAIEQPTDKSAAPKPNEQLADYQQQAIRALVELRENPGIRSLLADALLTELAQDNAVVAPVYDTTQGLGQHPVSNPSPPAHDERVPSLGAFNETAGSFYAKREGPGLVSPLHQLRQKNTPYRTPRRSALKRRTFRDIAEHHPRANGKSGFTVRELCTTMRISAASLTEARENPGRLSLNAVVALAEAMGECPMQVIMDLLAEAGTKRKKQRNKRGTQPQSARAVFGKSL